MNAVHNVVHGVAHAGTNLMHNIFGKRDAPQALTAKEEVCTRGNYNSIGIENKRQHPRRGVEKFFI